MSDPYVARGVARMFPGTVGGQSRVVTPLDVIRRKPRLVRSRPWCIRFEGQTHGITEGGAGVYSDQTIPLPDAAAGLTLLLLEESRQFGHVVTTFDLAVDALDGFPQLGPISGDRRPGISMWQRVLDGSETEITATIFADHRLAALILNTPRTGAFNDGLTNNDTADAGDAYLLFNSGSPTDAPALTPLDETDHLLIWGSSSATADPALHPTSPDGFTTDVAYWAGGAFENQNHLDMQATLGSAIGPMTWPSASYVSFNWVQLLVPLPC